jgi:hypothetical protein
LAAKDSCGRANVVPAKHWEPSTSSTYVTDNKKFALIIEIQVRVILTSSSSWVTKWFIARKPSTVTWIRSGKKISISTWMISILLCTYE